MSLQLLRGGRWACEVPLSMSLLGFGTMLANFHICGIMLVLRAIFNMLVRINNNNNNNIIIYNICIAPYNTIL